MKREGKSESESYGREKSVSFYPNLNIHCGWRIWRCYTLNWNLDSLCLQSTSTSKICSLQGWLSLIVLFRTSLIPPYSLAWDPLTHWCMTITGDRENSIFTQCRLKPNQRRTHQCLQYQFWKGLVYIDNFIWLWLT